MALAFHGFPDGCWSQGENRNEILITISLFCLGTPHSDNSGVGWHISSSVYDWRK